MCVNSWAKRTRGQSLLLPMNSEPEGQAALTTMVLYGTGVAHPFDRSV